MVERAEEAGGPDGGAGEGPGPKRRSVRRRVVAWVLAGCFLLALASPFYVGSRVRHLLTPVPRLGGAHDAAPVDVRAEDLARAEEIVFGEVRREAFPGAALAVGQRGRTLLERGYGRTGWTRLGVPVDPDRTLYDLSSLTKVVATTAAVMVLVDDGKMRLDDPVSRWLPALRGEGKERITVRHLLTHTSGLPAARELGEGSPRARLDRLIATVPLIDDPGASVLYSDVGFVVLAEAAARAAGEPLPAFVRRRVWAPLGMASTRFQPGVLCRACAPTLSLRDGSPFAGRTNDPFARGLGGVAGNAGLFSTAHDVGRFAAMVANGGELGGVRVVRESTLRAFTRAQPGAGTRALGFEVFCREGTTPNHETCDEVYAFGHTGYTGTSVWIDPARGVWVVLLTNRTYLPRAPDRLRTVRRRLYETVSGQAPPVRPDSVTASRARGA
ncbi:MAG TPA: serine hydrolase domain-containing protein [Longimicrobium sp.]|nr:serine hydrolase domain-containing protein [Longimicrobium sp.]